MQSKIVVVCGSVRFMDRILEMSERLELEEGYVVIGMLPHVLDRDLTDGERAKLNALHLAKIDLADAIFVVNVGGYIGSRVKAEIEYARGKGKEILFLEKTDLAATIF